MPECTVGQRVELPIMVEVGGGTYREEMRQGTIIERKGRHLWLVRQDDGLLRQVKSSWLRGLYFEEGEHA